MPKNSAVVGHGKTTPTTVVTAPAYPRQTYARPRRASRERGCRPPGPAPESCPQDGRRSLFPLRHRSALGKSRLRLVLKLWTSAPHGWPCYDRSGAREAHETRSPSVEAYTGRIEREELVVGPRLIGATGPDRRRPDEGLSLRGWAGGRPPGTPKTEAATARHLLRPSNATVGLPAPAARRGLARSAGAAAAASAAEPAMK